MRSSPEEEHQWVLQFRRALEDDEDDDVEGGGGGVFGASRASMISGVPKTLSSVKPEAYAPQIVAIGPYHRRRLELRDMETHKLSAARRARRLLPSGGRLGFRSLVSSFAELELPIRSHYHRYLDFDGETLAWLMAIDASFLLDFLESQCRRSPPSPAAFCRAPPSPFRYSGERNQIFRDILMLENQIPLFLLRRALEARLGSPELADASLRATLTEFLNQASPLIISPPPPLRSDHLSRCSHLLELLYCSIVDPVNRRVDHREPIGDVAEKEEEEEQEGVFLNLVLARLTTLTIVVVKLLVKVSWKLITTFPLLSLLKRPIEHAFAAPPPPPMVEEIEIEIPSATELAAAGVTFRPIRVSGPLLIVFDTQSAVFRLPAIRLDANTEPTLRNLVAYESVAREAAPEFARFVEVISGIVDDEEDVKVLRRSGVFVGRMRGGDEEVARMWNSPMTGGVRGGVRVPAIDGAVEVAKEYYEGRWKVKTKKVLRKLGICSFVSLRHLPLLLLVVLLMLVAQVFLRHLFLGGKKFGTWND